VSPRHGDIQAAIYFMRYSAVVLVVTGFLVLAQPIVAAAQSNENPEVLIGIGNELRRKGDNARAEGYFKRAYEVAHTPRSSAQLGLVELALKRFASSEAHLSEAINGDDAWVHAHAKALEDSRDEARKHLFGITIVGAPGDATANFGAGNVVPLGDGALWVAPGPVSFEVQAIGHKSAQVSVMGAEGETRQVVVSTPLIEAPPTVAAKPSSPPETTETKEPESSAAPSPAADQGETTASRGPGRALKIAGISAAGVGVVVGVVGAIVLAQGNAKHDRYANPATPYSTADANYATVQETGAALLIGGAVAVIGGAVLYVVGTKSKSDGNAVAFSVGPSFGVVEWKGRF
jgi:hypothetical protein